MIMTNQCHYSIFHKSAREKKKRNVRELVSSEIKTKMEVEGLRVKAEKERRG